MTKLLYCTTLLFILLASCKSIHVNADYDTSVNFSNYKTFAFHKPSIDQVPISDLDKRRILKAIDQTMVQKGFIKNKLPDLLISISTKAVEKVYVNQMNYGWGWGPGFNNPNFGYTDSVIEGILYIDIIDAKTKNLIWQGKGQGVLEQETHAKEAKIKEFVSQILMQYPPSNTTQP